MAKENIERLMKIKQGLVQMTSTVGWTYFKAMAKNYIDKTTDEAFLELDPDKRDTLIARAAALRKAFPELFAAVELTMQAVPDQEYISDFADMEFQTGDEQ
jgi:ABC-type Zn uptake system ZnuABC Zn-binding protein ZnuA